MLLLKFKPFFYKCTQICSAYIRIDQTAKENSPQNLSRVASTQSFRHLYCLKRLPENCTSAVTIGNTKCEIT